TAIQVSVYLQVSLVDKKTGKVLYNRQSMEFKQRYEIAVEQVGYFEESDIALARMSKDVARTVVSAVLEAFRWLRMSLFGVCSAGHLLRRIWLMTVTDG